MRKAYVEFCSRHNKSVKQYKELLARDKRFQQFIRRVSRGALLRRHGVQECILLVTQRVTKYPVLIDRILHNTKGNEEEAAALKDALVLIRELLSSVDQEVHDLERTQRLQEIHARLDPRAETNVQGNRAETTVPGSGAFRSGEIMRRRLMHEGPLLWKIGSRFKELIQTELHHVRTLRIMAEVFRRGMLEELQVEPALVHAVFPCLDELTDIHVNFLSQLLRRRKESLADGSQRNFIITQLGDILLSQFSGCSADRMRKAYVEFCSRHNKSVKQYKELLARDKRFQQFIRRVSRGALLRRHGVQECILLVTQRVTKYPVLIDRILHNTKGNEEEAAALKDALVLIRELLSSVDQEVHDLERTQRLQEIHARLDPRAETNVQGNQLIQTELHHVRTLRIMAEVFRRGMLEELQVEPALVHAVFPCLDELTDIHVNFLSQLLRRRKESLADGSQRNFIITQLGDILLSQFSGCSADRMRKAYVEFCSRHNKSVKQYKELLARDKRFQQFIRRVSRGALLRRHGVQECILLVTQRVTKYPVLIDRILHNTKDVQVLLMTDILVFLQEKDQKYTFPILDKPPVVSLKNLIVRDIANQERGMFLICDSTPPVMYEIHSASREDRNTWMKLIKQTVSSCPRREEFPLIETEDEALLRKLRGAIQQKDRELVELLQERVSLFSEVLEVQAGEGVSLCINTRNLFRAETPEAPRGEKLIMEAIREVERLGELLVGTGVELTVTGDQNHSLHRGEPEGQVSLAPNGEEVSVNGTHVFCRTDSNPEHRDRNGNQMQENSSSEAAVLQQDSLLELCQRGCSLPVGVAGGERGRDKLSRSLSRDVGLDAAMVGGTELVLLQRQHSLIQEELSRTRGSEARLRDSERARAENERQLRELREHSAALQAKLDILQRKEADKRPRHSRQNSLPNEGELRQGSAGQAARRGSEGDAATGAPLPLGKGVDQTDQSQRVHGDCSDPEANSEDEEEADELSTGSSSPRGEAAVLQQDSLLELCQRGCSLPGGVAGGERGRDKLSRSLSRDGGLDAAMVGGTELVLLQRQHSLIQEELSRTRGSEARLRDSERARAENERQLRELREHSAALQAKLDILQRKEADKRPRHSRQNSLPNEGELRQGSAGQAARRGSEGDAATGAPLPLGKGVDQTDQSQRVHGDCSDPEANSEDEEEADELSTGSSSPREFQRMHDIPEESECGVEQREAGTD
ncbi:UNVERIFIED_CONTAM: hypothetical protein FKN15_076847 [Acipenser sinensis]